MQAYVTPPEFQAHPTGLNVGDLVAGGGAAAQTAELALLTQQASSMVDQWVFYRPAAQSYTETRFVRPDNYGNLRVRLRQFPVQSITAAQWRLTARTGWQAINLAMIDLFPTLETGHQYVASDFAYGVLSGWGQPPLTVQTTYVAGYPNAQLTQAVVAGTISLTVDTTLGMQLGQTLTLYDGVSWEQVTIDPSGALTATTIPLTAGTLFAHAVGVRVADLPDAITLATIYATAWLIKERRAGGGLMMSGKVQTTNFQASEDMDFFRQLLLPYRRVI